MKKSKNLLLGLLALLMMSSLSLANGLNLNSLGTRALSMGGAFVGLADDFSTIFWNPAGIANFTNKTFGFYGTDILPSGTYKLTHPLLGTLVDAKTVSKSYLAGMAAYIHPITENLVAGLGVYTPSGLGATWDPTQLAAISGGAKNIEWTSLIGMVTISPTLAYKISDMFQIGASLNINYAMFDIKMYGGSYGVFSLGQYDSTMTGWGLGATFGLLFKPSSMFSFGATFRSASSVSFSGKATMTNLTALHIPAESDITRDLTWPMWLAGGVAFKPVENLTLTADVQYTNWKKIDKITTTYKDTMWNLLMVASGKNITLMNWKDATQIRFGAEYKISPAFAVRAGYYYDPRPAVDETMNILLPNYDFNVLAFGIGYAADGLLLEAGFEYLMGKEISIPLTMLLAMPGVYNMTIVAPNVSISYRF